MIDPECISYAAFLKIQDSMQRMSCADRGGNFIECASPIERMKAIKNETEIRNMKEAYLEDSAKLTQFLYWLKKNAAAGSAEPAGTANPPAESAATAPAAPAAPITEASAAAYLDGLRAEISDFVELSFPTISAYGENAAMMHYEPGADGGAILKPEGMYLVDSGGQYLRGTTDVTRTIALGPVTEDMKKSYTLTAVSQLQLMGLTFLYGCSGLVLDVIARSPLWAEGIDYKCGTGHGIGYLLNVHEGPQSFRYRKRSDGEDTPMEAGMVISDEPGVYKEGRYGIRIETILLTVPKMETEDGKFLGFEPLTFVPLDPELIDPKYLTPKARDLLNAYHKEVCEKITPLLPTEEERAWLKEQCREI
jgi:Xaa-Pro aminopeptidase